MQNNIKNIAFCQGMNEFEAKKTSAPYNNNEYEPIKYFLYVPTLEEIKKNLDPKIEIPAKQINEEYHIKKLKQLKQKKKKLYPKKNNINFIDKYNLFFGLAQENENNIYEKKENLFYNIDKLGQDNTLLFHIKAQKRNNKANITNINNLYNKKNKSSKNLLNIKQYKKIIDEKINLDEYIVKVDSVDDFEININNNIKKLFH